jgi:hypothetical protein
MESVPVLNSRSRLVYPIRIVAASIWGLRGPGLWNILQNNKKPTFQGRFFFNIRYKRETIRSHMKRGAAPVGIRFLVSVQFRLKIADNRYIPVRPFLNSAIQCG